MFQNVEETLPTTTAPDIRVLFQKRAMSQNQPISWGNLPTHWICLGATWTPHRQVFSASDGSQLLAKSHRGGLAPFINSQDPCHSCHRQKCCCGKFQMVDNSSSCHVYGNLGLYPWFSIVGQCPMVQDLQLSRNGMN